MSVFKFRHERRGGHVHVAVFVAKAVDQTFAKSGDLVFSAGQEFDDFRFLVTGAIVIHALSVIVEEMPP